MSVFKLGYETYSFISIGLLSHDSVPGAYQSEYILPKTAFCFRYHFAIIYCMERHNFIFFIDPCRLFFCFHTLKFLSKPLEESHQQHGNSKHKKCCFRNFPDSFPCEMHKLSCKHNNADYKWCDHTKSFIFTYLHYNYLSFVSQ